jgi:RNA polymerase sigma factor (sigma-70 family)
MKSVGSRPQEDDDEGLIQRARQGDVRAYELLVERYQGIAHRTAYAITGSSADAEDAAQDAFVKAFYSLDRFRSESPFRPWLLTIVANEARNRRRSAARRTRLALRAGQAGASGDAAPSPEVVAIERREQEAVLDAVEGLRDKDREVVVLRYFLDMSESEMATVLGCAPGTVKSRLSRALVRLRRRLDRSGTGLQEEIER